MPDTIIIGIVYFVFLLRELCLIFAIKLNINMKNKYLKGLILLGVLMNVNFAFSQLQSYKAQKIGNGFLENDLILSDSKSDLIYAGQVLGMNDIKFTAPSYNLNSDSGRLYIFKTDTTHAIKWSFTFGDLLGSSTIGDINIDVNDNIYIGGNYINKVDFDPAPNKKFELNFPNFYTALSKYNSNGVFQWAIPLGDVNGAKGGIRKITSDPTGNVYICASTVSITDIDPGAGSTNIPAGANYIAKYSAAGALLWSNYVMGGIFTAITTDGNRIFVGGSFDDIMELNPKGTSKQFESYNFNDGYVSEYSVSNGSFMNAWQLRGGFSVSIIGLAIGNGHFYVCGGFFDTLDVDPSSNVKKLIKSKGSFLAKYNYASMQYVNSVIITATFDSYNVNYEKLTYHPIKNILQVNSNRSTYFYGANTLKLTTNYLLRNASINIGRVDNNCSVLIGNSIFAAGTFEQDLIINNPFVASPPPILSTSNTNVYLLKFRYTTTVVDTDVKSVRSEIGVSMKYYGNSLYIHNEKSTFLNKLTIYNAMGQKIDEILISGTDELFQFDLSRLSNGAYFCVLESNSSATSFKFLKDQ